MPDHSFNRDGSLRYVENVDVGFLGDTILVNGAVAPRIASSGGSTASASLNASNSRIYDLGLGRGRPWCRSAATAACSSGAAPLERASATRPSASTC